MPTEYAKDKATGIVAINCDGTATFTDDTPEGIISRNTDGRVFLPSNQKPFVVKVECDGKETIVASGVTNTPSLGKATPIWVRVRAELEATIPDAPAVEELD